MLTKINPKNKQVIANAIKNEGKYGGEFDFISAQFKNHYVKKSSLTPKVIEAILTKIVNERVFEQPGWLEGIMLYSDDYFMYEKGVRAFCFSDEDVNSVSSA